ncbi:hypothetical protein V490_01581 [Pseudogymnoascus sp. VKM F-3557]|nr:hypothetical protein V490_01581 [Pseudogymnoascus sp. VKM F-3557]
MAHLRHTNGSQAVSTQQSTPTIQRANAPIEPQTAQRVYNASPATPPAKRRKVPSENHLGLRSTLRLIEQHDKSCGGIKHHPARERIEMVWKACVAGDYFYVALHQMFCLYALEPELAAMHLSASEGTDLRESFSLISRFITQNKPISAVHTKFFSEIPGGPTRTSERYKRSVNHVAIFLSNLSLKWPKYYLECTQRRYAPSVDELVNRFGAFSPILQRFVIATTQQDLEARHQIAARVDTTYLPPEREIESGQINQAHMGLSLQGPSQPNFAGRVWPPTKTPSATQAGQSPPIHTSVMPSVVVTASPQPATLPAPSRFPHRSAPEHSPSSPMPSRPQSRSFRGSQMNPTLSRPNQAPNMQCRQGRVDHVVRSAPQNASGNAYPNTSGSSSPTLTDPARPSSSVYASIRPAQASRPARQGSQLPQQQVSSVSLRRFAVNPTALLDWMTTLSFSVSKVDFASPTAPQYRVRCCRVNEETQKDNFIISDTNWPPTIFMEINDIILEIRRKSQYGRDLPVDITPHVVNRGPEKENKLGVASMKGPERENGISYSIAIEVVEVFSHQQIVDMCLKQRIVAKDVIGNISAKLFNSQIGDGDDVSLVSSNLSIDLTDPFISRIFTHPVRSILCRHLECFDLRAFLVSLSNTPPELWKCPLCGGDATLPNLRVDDFLVSVREKLRGGGDLAVKAILVAKDGSWTPKLEAPPAVGRDSSGAPHNYNDKESDSDDEENDSGDDSDEEENSRNFIPCRACKDAYFLFGLFIAAGIEFGINSTEVRRP